MTKANLKVGVIFFIFCLIFISFVSSVKADTLWNGLRGYWNFNEVSGDIYVNSVSGGRNLTLSDSHAPGILGSSWNMTASTIDSTNIPTYETMTVNMWVRYQKNYYFIGSADGAGADGNWRWVSQPTNNMGFYVSDSSGEKNIHGTQNPNDWEMWTMVVNNTDVLMYQNGTLVSQTSLDNWQGNPVLYMTVGMASNNAVGMNLDELSIFNRTLSSSEVSDLWNNGVGKTYTVPSKNLSCLSGGTVTKDGNYCINTFLSNGVLNVNSPISNAEVLIIAGGGSGGTDMGGGGGAGGVIHTHLNLSSGSYDAIVGLGGTGNGFNANLGAGNHGLNSSFAGLEAFGGGGGTSYDGSTYLGFGGSGGGGQGGNSLVSGGSSFSSQGYSGGSGQGGNGGGGGGAGSVGIDGSPSQQGDGGNGLTFSISGSSVCYAGGGGGGAQVVNAPAGVGICGGGNGSKGTDVSGGKPGINGLGGGGGASSNNGGSGGDGGSGIVIVRYIPQENYVLLISPNDTQVLNNHTIDFSYNVTLTTTIQTSPSLNEYEHSDLSSGGADASGLAQVFTIGANGANESFDLNILSVQQIGSNVHSTTCNYTVWQNFDGSTFSDALSSALTNCSELSSNGWHNITMPTTRLDAGGVYYFSLVSPTDNNLAQDGANYPGGHNWYSLDAGTTWHSQGASLGFQLFGTNISAPSQSLVNSTIHIFNYSSSNNPLWNGLKVYYKFDETSGTEAVDSVGGNHNLATTNGQQISSGKINYGYNMNGNSGQSVGFTDDTPDRTWNIWIWKLGNFGYSNGLLGTLDTDFIQARGEGISLWGQGSYTGCNVGGGAGMTLDTSAWNMVTVIKNSTGLAMYKDGVFYGSCYNTANITSTTQEYIMGAQGTGNSFDNAYIDEVGLWNRSLSDAEITDLYNNNVGKIFIPNTQTQNIINETTTTHSGITSVIVSNTFNFANGIYSWFADAWDNLGNYFYSPTQTFEVNETNNVNSSEIYSWSDLNNIRNDLSKDYYLMVDLNSSSPDYNGIGNAWISTELYSGEFYGQNHKISDLVITNSITDGSNYYSGLFGHLNGVITNLGLVNISNSVSGNFLGTFAGTIDNGQIYYSYSTGKVSGDSGSYSGGIAAQMNSGKISNCYSTVDVTGNSIGGFVGIGTSGTELVENSYYNGHLSGQGNQDAIFGQSGGGIKNNTYWDMDTTGIGIQDASSYTGGLSDVQMKAIDNYVNWNISTSLIDLNNGYPYLSWQDNKTNPIWLIYTIPAYNPSITITSPKSGDIYYYNTNNPNVNFTYSVSKIKLNYLANITGVTYQAFDSNYYYAICGANICAYNKTNFNLEKISTGSSGYYNLGVANGALFTGGDYYSRSQIFVTNSSTMDFVTSSIVQNGFAKETDDICADDNYVVETVGGGWYGIMSSTNYGMITYGQIIATPGSVGSFTANGKCFISPNKDYIYLTGSGTNYPLYVYNYTDLSLVSNSLVIGNGSGAYIGSDNNNIYVENPQSSKLMIYNLTNLKSTNFDWSSSYLTSIYTNSLGKFDVKNGIIYMTDTDGLRMYNANDFSLMIFINGTTNNSKIWDASSEIAIDGDNLYAIGSKGNFLFNINQNYLTTLKNSTIYGYGNFSCGIGGTLSEDGDYCVHVFTANDTFYISRPLTNVEVFIVAGGGAGNYGLAGGGAGGVIHSFINLTAGSQNVTVGAGGLPTNICEGGNGVNSSFGNLQAEGGGAGGCYNNHGQNGGSGGGGGQMWGSCGNRGCHPQGGSGIPGQGFDGGLTDTTGTGGGGGGAGSPGNGSGNYDGGIGVNFTLNGVTTCYAGGGAGGSGVAVCGGGNPYQVGVDGTGGGGGATTNLAGVSGGSGIVIIKYPKNIIYTTEFAPNTTTSFISIPMRFLEGVYTWFANVFDTGGNSAQSENQTFSVQSSSISQMAINQPLNNSLFTNPFKLKWYAVLNHTTIDSCSYSIDNGDYIPNSPLYPTITNWIADTTTTYDGGFHGHYNYHYTIEYPVPQGIEITNSILNTGLVGYLTNGNPNPSNNITIPSFCNTSNGYLSLYISIVYYGGQYVECWDGSQYQIINACPGGYCFGATGRFEDNPTSMYWKEPTIPPTQTNITITPPIGNHSINVKCNDTLGRETITENNYFSYLPANITITNPVQNTTYNIPPNQIDYTLTYINMTDCSYSLDKGVTNNSIICGQNITNIQVVKGNQVWTIYAYDLNNNLVSSSVNFTFSPLAPSLTMINPPYNVNFGNSSVDFTYDISDNFTNLKNTTLNIYYENGTLYSQTEQDLVNISTTIINHTINLPDGAYYWNANAFNIFDIENQSRDNIFEIDTNSPAVNIIYPEDFAWYNYTITTANFSLIHLDSEVDACWYKIDGGNNITTPCSKNVINNITGLSISDGTHTLKVCSNDTSNNIGCHTHTFYVDTTAPIINFGGSTAADNANLTQNAIVMDITYTEPNCAYTNYSYRTIGSSSWITSQYNNCLSTFVASPLSVGSYEYFAQMKDTLGHLSSTPTRNIILNNMTYIAIPLTEDNSTVTYGQWVYTSGSPSAITNLYDINATYATQLIYGQDNIIKVNTFDINGTLVDVNNVTISDVNGNKFPYTVLRTGVGMYELHFQVSSIDIKNLNILLSITQGDKTITKNIAFGNIVANSLSGITGRAIGLLSDGATWTTQNAFFVLIIFAIVGIMILLSVVINNFTKH